MDLLKTNEGKYDLVMNYESRSKVIHESHFFQSLSVSVAKFEMSTLDHSRVVINAMKIFGKNFYLVYNGICLFLTLKIFLRFKIILILKSNLVCLHKISRQKN